MTKLIVENGLPLIDKPKRDANNLVNSTFKRIGAIEKNVFKKQSDLTRNQVFLDQSYYKTDD